MHPLRTAIAIAVAAAFCGTALAQTAGSEIQRNVNQQQRIEQGLKSGQLNTREAAKLENGEARVDRLEGSAMKDGSVSDVEQARIRKAQNAESKAIYAQKHDAQTGNPASASSQRMQADVQRNANQQARIKQGVTSGTLTTAEAGSLERGQAHAARKEAVAGANGRVGGAEQASIQATENRQSARVYHKKHNTVAASSGH